MILLLLNEQVVLFNSLAFLVFLPLVFLVYWLFLNRSLKLQNAFIVVSSYFFYGWWDWRFLSLIIFSTLADYFVGLYLGLTVNKKKRRYLLWTSILLNLGILGFFKYYDFFVGNFIEAFNFVGIQLHASTLNILLPVGISFYTFQTLSYTIDIYREKLEPTKDIIAFGAYVAFFPQLVAGPIERASNLLPQILRKRKFSNEQATEGLKLILWGFVKKMAIADALAPIVDDIFGNASAYPSSTLLMGAVFFAFQIYGDFSGYSDIAIGTSKLFGFELMSNFKFPYFSRNIGEFWRRWHISLSTWFKDYLYIPLGGSRVKASKAIRNIFIIFLVSGFWHGANWTFIFWGFFHALLFLPTFMVKKNRRYMNTTNIFSSVGSFIKEGFQILSTFILVLIGWVFFRSATLKDAFTYLKKLSLDFSFSQYDHPNGYRMLDYFILLAVFVVFEYLIRKDERRPFKFKSPIIRFVAYTLCVLVILLFYDDGVDRSFIYFQF